MARAPLALHGTSMPWHLRRRRVRSRGVVQWTLLSPLGLAALSVAGVDSRPSHSLLPRCPRPRQSKAVASLPLTVLAVLAGTTMMSWRVAAGAANYFFLTRPTANVAALGRAVRVALAWRQRAAALAEVTHVS